MSVSSFIYANEADESLTCEFRNMKIGPSEVDLKCTTCLKIGSNIS